MKRTMEFTLKVSNCLGCHFCPQDKLGKAYSGPSTMTADQFVAILHSLPEDVEIHFSGFSEPFLNPLCVDMIVAAKHLNRKVHIYSTLMGLTTSGALRLADKRYHPEYFRIHVPDKKGLVIPDDRWISQDEKFRSTGISASYMAMGEPTDKVRDYILRQHTRLELPDMLSRGGNLWNPKTLSGPIRCTMNRWHSNVVLPNGEIYGCCMDYSLTVPLGNIFNVSYDKIFENGEAWRKSVERESSGTICSHCEWATPG